MNNENLRLYVFFETKESASLVKSLPIFNKFHEEMVREGYLEDIIRSTSDEDKRSIVFIFMFTSQAKMQDFIQKKREWVEDHFKNTLKESMESLKTIVGEIETNA